MRILYLSPSGQLGGAERVLLDILASLRDTAPQWELGLIVNSDGPLATAATNLGVATRIVPFPPALARLGDAALNGAGQAFRLAKNLAVAVPQMWAYRRQLRAAIQDFAPHIVHSNGLKMHLLSARAGLRAPLVWHIHDYVGRRALMSRLLRWHAGSCALLIANSQSVAADVQQVCRAEAVTLYNAVDVQEFAPEGERLDLDALAGLPPCPPETVRVGLLATLALWKGHEVFLRALARLPPALPVRGYLIGGALYQSEGSQTSLAELQQIAQSLDLGGRAGFMDFVREPAAAMRALDIVVHASTAPEPFGLVIVEGMACGRAVIASRAGGVLELFEEGQDALGHTPGDAQDLARCIEKLATDTDLRAALGRAGRATATQRFDRQRLATELIPLYERLRSDNSIFS